MINGVSAEQITKDAADFFRTLLLYKEGIRRTDILGTAIQDIPENIVASLSREQIEAALKAFLSLYRDLRYSLSPRFEIELLFSRLASLPYLTSPEILVKKIEDLKNGVAEGSVVIKTKVQKVIEAGTVSAPVSTEKAGEPEEVKEETPDQPPVPSAEIVEPAEEEEPEEEEDLDQTPPDDDFRTFSAKDIPQAAETLARMGRAVSARYLEAIEKIEEAEDGTLFLTLSKPLAYNNLKLSEKDVTKAIASVIGHPVTIKLKLEEKKAITEEDFSEDMRRLKSFLGGKLTKTAVPETADDTETREENYESIRDVEADEFDPEQP